MTEGWWVLVGAVLIAVFMTLLGSAEDRHTEIVDQRGCRVIEHVDNPVLFSRETRTVNTYCPEGK